MVKPHVMQAKPRANAFLTLLLFASAGSACRGCGCGTDAASLPAPVTSQSSAADSASSQMLSRRLPENATPEERVLFAIRPKMNECYRNASRERQVEGEAMLDVTIRSSDGQVTAVQPTSQTGLDVPLMECVSAAIKAAVFPSLISDGGGSLVIHVPLVFRAPREAGAAPRRAGPFLFDASHD